MKKLAAFLTAVMLFTLLAVPAMASPDSDEDPYEPPTVVINPQDPMPDPNAEEAPEVVIVDEDAPLADGSDIGGDAQQEGDVVVERPRIKPGTYVRYNDPRKAGPTFPRKKSLWLRSRPATTTSTPTIRLRRAASASSLKSPATCCPMPSTALMC